MVRPADQKRVRNAEPMFVRQLDLIEIKDDETILEAIKRKFQAEANRQQWIRDDAVSIEDLEDYEARLKEFYRIGSSREEDLQTEADKQKFGRGTLRYCEEKAVTTPVSSALPYTEYGSGMLHSLADHLVVGWHPDWKTRLSDEEDEVLNDE